MPTTRHATPVLDLAALPAAARDLVRRRVRLPHLDVPPGRVVELPGRGSTYVVDVPGPADRPDAPTVVLLHAVACTGLLTWFPTIPALAAHARVVTLDQRWHGQGIQSPSFSLVDCADDVAALLDVLGVERAVVGGFSMGSIVAQRVWRQHPDRVAGLVLAATTDRFRETPSERAFHAATEVAVAASRGVARSRTLLAATRAAARRIDPGVGQEHDWALDQFRSTSPWAVSQAVGALGRHHSRPWLGRIDVPTAVVVPVRDRVIPPARQYAVARAIPGATVHEVEGGHACCTLEAEAFVPVMVDAVRTVHARRDDLPRRRR